MQPQLSIIIQKDKPKENILEFLHAAVLTPAKTT